MPDDDKKNGRPPTPPSSPPNEGEEEGPVSMDVRTMRAEDMLNNRELIPDMTSNVIVILSLLRSTFAALANQAIAAGNVPVAMQCLVLVGEIGVAHNMLAMNFGHIADLSTIHFQYVPMPAPGQKPQA